MGIGVGLLLVAAGAILAFAVEKDLEGLDVQVVGVILIVVGVTGILLDLLLWHSWRPAYRRARYVEAEPPPAAAYPPRRRTVVEEEDVAPPPPGPPPPGPPPP